MDKVITRRKQWVDALRAMAIIFVVFGHTVQWCFPFFQYTTAIKIPLFFAISGYVFKYDDNILTFIKHWFLKLIFPYFCLVTIPALLFSITHGSGYLFDCMQKMISGESYWFMPCLIIAELMWYFILKYSKSTLFVILFSFVFSSIGFILKANNVLDYACINISLTCLLFLLLGYLFRLYESILIQIQNYWKGLILLLYILMCFFSPYIFADMMFDIHLGEYFNIPYCLAMILLGCFGVMLAANYINNFPHWLVYVGQNTLMIYLWAFWGNVFFVVLGKFGFHLQNGTIYKGLIETAVSITICCVLSIVVNRYIPEIVGRKRK